MFAALGILYIIGGTFKGVILGFFICVFGLLIIIFELISADMIKIYFQFYWLWFGRGGFFIFVACLILSTAALELATGVIGIAIGLMYVLFGFLRTVPFPQPFCGGPGYETRQPPPKPKEAAGSNA
eukprot:g70946.t1